MKSTTQQLRRSRIPFLSMVSFVVCLAVLIVTFYSFNNPANAAAAPIAPACSERVLNVVAHPDDDLLFLSPSLAQHIKNGDCVRTVFVTAADDNNPRNYWHDREDGVRDAYALMAGAANKWKSTIVTTHNHQLHVSSLIGNQNVSLVFMRLPDGNGDGDGFSNNSFESLQKLWQNKIPTINAVDGSSNYTKQDLIDTLASLMSDFKAYQIHTQDFAGGYGDGDHSDHHTVAYLTRRAHREYGAPNVLTGYEDYSTFKKAANVTTTDYSVKNAAFFAYAQHDFAICKSHGKICQSGLYGGWVQRQYTVGTEVASCVQSPNAQPKRKPDFYDSFMRAYFYQPVCY